MSNSVLSWGFNIVVIVFKALTLSWPSSSSSTNCSHSSVAVFQCLVKKNQEDTSRCLEFGRGECKTKIV